MRRVKRGEAEQTIVDLTDNRKLIVMISTSKARQIIYNPNNGSYNPDFSKEPMVLTPELYITGSPTNVIATAETVKWYVRPNTLGQRIPIENDDTYSIGNDFKLTISKNIMKDMLTMEFILEVIYKEPDSDFRTTIPHHMELVNISMGEDGRDGIDGLDGLDGEMGLPGPKGKDGESSYTHLAYANNETGTQEFSLSDSNRSYIGMYVDNLENDSTNPSDYKWTKVEGMPGEKGIQGPKGSDGRTPYFHIAYATNEDGTEGFSVSDSVGKTYIGQYTDYIENDSTKPSDYSWTLIKGEQGPRGLQGLQGEEGLQGPKGLDSYTHIAYANNETGTIGFSTSDSIDKLYIGMYVDNHSVDSTNPSDYKWTKARGDDGTDGSQGIPGKAGADGRTPYFHTAYANSEDGVTGFSTTISKDKLYLGQYTDYIENDSTKPSDYSWTLIKGEDGKDGVAGKDGVGVSNTTITYAQSSNGTTAPSTGYTTTVPTLTKGNYLWTKTVWTYTDKTTETGYSVAYIAKDGNDGSNGLAGKDGVGIKTTTITYAKSTSGTVKPTTGYTTTIPTVANGQYLWTKTTWTYTDNTSEDGYSVAKMGETGSTGPRGLQGLQGPQGNQGVQGPKGLDSYTHIAYSTSPTGATGFSTTDSTNKTYIGMYVDNTKADSTKPSDYNWTLIKGEKGADGSQGIPGKTGANGKTPYFHIAYNSAGPNMFSTRTWESTEKKESTNVPYITLTGLSPNTKYLVTTNISPRDKIYYDVFADTDFEVKPISSSANGVPVDNGREVLSSSTGTIDVGMRSYSLSEGVYWIKVVNPFENFSTEDSTGRTHIGQYTDYTENDSNNPNDYEWTLIKGSNGAGVNANLLRKSNVPYSTTEYKVSEYEVTDDIPVGAMVTLTVWGDLGERPYWNPHVNGASISLSGTGGEYDYINKKYVVTVPWRTSSPYTSVVAKPPYVIHMYGGIGGSNSGKVTIEKVKLEYGEESTPWVPAESEMEGATLAIITPDGTTTRDTTSSLKLESKLFIGGREVTADSYKWYYPNGSTTTTLSTGKTTTISATIVKNSLPIFLDATYKGTTYTSNVTINDISDVYTSIILGVATFKNGKGSNTYTVKLYRNGEEIDTGGSQYSYEWEKLNSQGVKDTKFNKTGKTITINASDIDNTNMFNCYIYTK